MAAASRKHGKRPASGITVAPPRQADDADFRGRVAEALTRFGDPAWLGRHSVLATPYLLDDAGASASDDPEQRGRALQRILLAAAQSLPAATGAYDPQRLLEAAFFHPNPARTNEGIAVISDNDF